MSTTTTETSSKPKKEEKEAPQVIVKCPNCGSLFDKESAALTPWTPQEFPKTLYKIPGKAVPEEPVEQPLSVTVANAEEQEEKEAEGYGEDIPQPPTKPDKPLKPPVTTEAAAAHPSAATKYGDESSRKK